MANEDPKVKRTPIVGVPMEGPPPLEAHEFEIDVADFIINNLEKFVDKDAGEIDYSGFAEEILRFIESLKIDPTEDFLQKVRRALSNAITSRVTTSDLAAIYTIFADKLLDEVEDLLQDKGSEYRLVSGILDTVPYPMHNYFGGAIDGWYRISRRIGTLNGGLFFSGDIGTIATAYSSLKTKFVDESWSYDCLTLRGTVSTGLGVFFTMPSNFRERYILGAVPSVSAFGMAEVAMGYGFELRVGAELSPAVPMGIHTAVDPIIPLETGASLVYRINDDFAVGILAKLLSYVYQYKIQDSSSIGLVYDNTTSAFTWMTPIVDGELGVEFFNNETSAYASLDKSFPFLGGMATVGVSGRFSIDGRWTAFPPSFFVTLGYSWGDDESGFKVYGSVDTNIMKQTGDLSYSDATPLYSGVTIPPYLTEDLTGTEFTCTRYSSRGDFTCRTPLIESAIQCRENSSGILECSIGQDDDYRMMADISFNLTYERDNPDERLSYYYTMEFPPNIDIYNKGIEIILASTSLQGFVKRGLNLDYSEQVHLLSLIMAKLYAVNYNSEALISATGGKVNDSTDEDIYVNLRTSMTSPADIDPNTVCRNISKFIAAIANAWGMEAHPISLSSGKFLHSVTMLREGSGEPYGFLNGDVALYSSSLAVMPALLQYAAYAFPPQLRFGVFDSDGRYERILPTNLWRQLETSVTTGGLLDRSLGFK